MSKIKTMLWPIEPHTEAKHAILRKYLNAWLPIITRWNGRVLYIDGFAGPGEYINGEDGSPVIAIKAVLEHKADIKSEIKMLFIEAKEDRFKNLQQKIATLKIPSNIKPICVCDRFDAVLTKILDDADKQQMTLIPTFVFIDPFGFTGIPFALIKRIMKNPHCEVFITFMYEEINRFSADEKLWGSLNDMFGTNEWQKAMTENDPRRRELLWRSIYKKQLEKEADIKFINSFKMVNKINKTDYFLFFGTNNIKGLKMMKAAMWKVDEGGLFQFSDATNPAQPMLFEKEPNFNQLKKIILQNFKGKSLSIEELEYFILTQTFFRETHYKTSILVPMEKSQPPEIQVKSLSNKRRKGTFPPGCIIEFL